MDPLIQLQLSDTPLFPAIVWNRPETKHGAGKLLIVGGNKFKFFAPAQAQHVAQQTGAGVIKVLLPDATKKMIGLNDTNEYAASNPSGSFSKNATENILSLAQWSDAVLLAGDAGHNSETSLMTEKFLSSFEGQVTIAQDFLDMFINNPEIIITRKNTLIVASFIQLQKITSYSGYREAFTSSMPLRICLERIKHFSSTINAYIITTHQNHIIVAVRGRVSYMKVSKDCCNVEQAAKSAVWWMQQPKDSFEALTTSLLEHTKINQMP